jgi:hypothetical protein
MPQRRTSQCHLSQQLENESGSQSSKKLRFKAVFLVSKMYLTCVTNQGCLKRTDVANYLEIVANYLRCCSSGLRRGKFSCNYIGLI